MKKLDWKALGQFLSVFLNLFTLIRNTFAKINVGIEIIPWLTGEGKDGFVKEFLVPLGQKFLASRPAPVKKSVVVDLGAFPKLPFNGASVLVHTGTGQAKLERRGDDLYLDGRKLELFLSEKQRNGSVIRGHALRDELTGKAVVNANVLDALLANPELIPDSWKKDERGNTRYIFFWGTIYRNAGGSLCVRCLCFSGGRWHWGCFYLDDGFGDSDPAAVSAS